MVSSYAHSFALMVQVLRYLSLRFQPPNHTIKWVALNIESYIKNTQYTAKCPYRHSVSITLNNPPTENQLFPICYWLYISIYLLSVILFMHHLCSKLKNSDSGTKTVVSILPAQCSGFCRCKNYPYYFNLSGMTQNDDDR